MLKDRLFQKKNIILFAVLLLGFGLRIWGLWSAEIFHDEGIDAFRSIGYLDYIQNDDQSTPIQWFKDLPQMPWWTNLSFHDHPPLFFALQHIFFRFLGDSIFVARLPSFLAGMFAIFLVYLIGKTLFRRSDSLNSSRLIPHRNEETYTFFSLPTSEIMGLSAAFLLAINHIHIWISRSSIIESVLMTLILANIYFFLKFLEDKKYWKWFGLTLGLCFLTKYTSFFLIPVYAAYVLLYRRDLLRAWHIWGAAVLALILFSPVVMYNAYLFGAVHHFDLQFSYLFHQPTPEWGAQLGKVQEPFSNITPNLLAMYSKPFLGFALGGLLIALWTCFRPKKAEKQIAVFALLLGFFATLMLAAVGSAFRFLALYLPAAILFLLMIFWWIREMAGVVDGLAWKNTVVVIVAVLFVTNELYFTVEGIYLTFPDFGIVRLDQYLNTTLGSVRPLLLPQSPNPHMDKVIRSFAQQHPRSDRKILLVYDENVSLSERLWLFTRRLFYHGMPTLTTGNFRSLLQSRGAESLGGHEVYFVKASPHTLLNPYVSIPDAEQLEGFLRIELQLNPEITIYGYQHLPMFYVYKILF